MNRLFVIAPLIAAAGLAALPMERASAADAPPSVFLIDGSGSMWGTFATEKIAKVYAIRDSLRLLLTKASPQSRIGLASFGHRRKGDCGDVELMIPPEAGSVERIGAALDKFNPKGKGPIALALKEVARAIGPGAPGTITLIHDGPDNCQQDVCATAGEIAKSNPKLAIHVLSLGLEAADAARVSCAATLTGGQTFVANDQATAMSALEQIFALSELGSEAAPQASAPVSSEPTANVAQGPPGLRLTAALANGGPALQTPVQWRISKDGEEATPLIERSSPEINEALAPGRYMVAVSHGMAIKRETLDVGDQGPTAKRMVLDAGTLKISAKASRLGDQLHHPVITVASQGASDTPAASRPLWIGRTGASDLIVPAATYSVRVSDGLASATANATVAAGGVASTELVLETGLLELTAVAFDGGPPLQRPLFTVAVDDPDAPQGRREIARSAAPAPRFMLQAGTYYLTAKVGPITARERVAISSGDIVKKALVLGMAQLKVSARLQGQDVPGDAPLQFRVLDGSTGGTVIAESAAPDSRFDLPAGRYRIEARLGGANAKTTQVVDLVSGKDADIVFKIDAAKVSLGPATGAVAKDRRIEIRDAAGATVWRPNRADPQSQFLAPGKYTIRTEADGAAAEQPIDLKSGEQRVLNQ